MVSDGARGAAEAISMSNAQPGLLEPVPRLARYLTFSLCPRADARGALAALAETADGREVVVGIGQSLVLHLGRAVDGLRVFSAHVGDGFEVRACSPPLPVLLLAQVCTDCDSCKSASRFRTGDPLRGIGRKKSSEYGGSMWSRA